MACDTIMSQLVLMMDVDYFEIKVNVCNDLYNFHNVEKVSVNVVTATVKNTNE